MFGVQNYRKSNKLRTITSNYIKYLTRINITLPLRVSGHVDRSRLGLEFIR